MNPAIEFYNQLFLRAVKVGNKKIGAGTVLSVDERFLAYKSVVSQLSWLHSRFSVFVGLQRKSLAGSVIDVDFLFIPLCGLPVSNSRYRQAGTPI
jgi:hypothetical protein